MFTSGGFVPQAYALAAIPELTITADGGAIMSGPVPDIYPGPALPNLLAGEALAPEFFQEAVIPANLCAALERVLDDTARREYLQRRFQAIHESLRAGGAARAAQAVLQLLAETTGGRSGVGRADSGSR